MAGTETEYWDSCVFLALLKGEPLREGESAYLEQQALRFDMGQLNLVTSSITLTEILACKLTPQQWQKFKAISAQSNFQFIDANARVCELASEIRNFYFENPPPRQEGAKVLKLMTPDAIHVASAIAAQTALKQPIKLLTFDTEDKPTRNDMAMVRLNGMVANKYRLSIGRPDLTHQQSSLALVGGKTGLGVSNG
jgi:predicted nucleic acid-binding protein